MNGAIVYLSAIGFFLAVFPLHVFNYVYITTEEGYASLNVSLFRLIPIFNVNTVKNSLTKMSVNGNEKQMDSGVLKSNPLKIFNQICITKIVQLGDFGLKKESNVYLALAQSAATQAAFTFVRINGGRVKLKNYTLFNYGHDHVAYYLKLVGVINLISVTKLIFILILEKLNERKNQKIAKRQSV